MSQSILKKSSYGSFGSGSGVYEYEYEYEFITSFKDSFPSSLSEQIENSGKKIKVLGYGINLI